VHIVKIAIEEEIPAACGKPGEPGNPAEILRAANRISDVCRTFLEWELELSSIIVEENLQNLMNSLHGSTLGIIKEIKRLPNEISDALTGEWTGTRRVQITLNFAAPPQLAKFAAELKEVKRHPEWL
jgi:hypothetical protein